MANILIVDDSKTSRKVLRQILEQNGHTVIGEAINGTDGLEKYKALKPELTTMDITMPVLSGIEALKQIIEFDNHAKIIMVTAAGQKNNIVNAFKCGAAEYLTKPYEAEHIMKIVEKILEK